MSSVQQTSSLSNVSICKFAIPLEQLHHVPRSWFYLHHWIAFNENQWWSGASQAKGWSGSLLALFRRGVSITVILPCCKPLTPSQPHGKNYWRSSCFSYVINFSLCVLTYWEINCINRIVPCSFHFISLCSFPFLFISIIIRAHSPFIFTKFMI